MAKPPAWVLLERRRECDDVVVAPTVFLIGPSRIGKTTAGRLVAVQLEGVHHHDLDEDVKPFRQPGVNPVVTAQDWAVLEPILTAYESGPSGLAIVDIGAGTQNMVETGRRQIIDWLMRPHAVVVLLTAEPEFAWTRWIDGRPESKAEGFSRFIEQEFTGRESLYALASHTIDVTSRPSAAVADELLTIARSLLR